MSDHAAPPPTPIAPLLAVNFVGTLGFSIVTPFLVVLVGNWGGNAVVYGVLAATYSFFQLFGAPVLGRLSDRIGRRRVLIYSQLGTLLSWAVFLIAFALPDVALLTMRGGWLGEFALTLPLLVLFLARAADGLTGGNVSVSNAYLADITEEEDRSRNFGRMAISSNMGFIFGPMLAGLLGATALGAMLPVLAAFVISALALLLIRFGLSDHPVKTITAPLEQPSACDLYGQEHRPGYAMRCAPAPGLRGLLALPNLALLLLINFLVMLGFSFFYVAFPVHAFEVLKWQVAEIGIFFAFLSLAMILVQGPLLSRLSDQVSAPVLMAGGGALLALGFALIALPQLPLLPGPISLYLAALLIALGNGTMWPTFMAVLSGAVDSRLQGVLQGYSQSIGAVASIAGLVAGGVFYVGFGAQLFLWAAALIALSALLSARFRPPPPRAPTN